ncbi:helix-turn-helix domain-containing protein [Butyrivibrio sp. MC2013]|uniref:helix-turn-helix domain-containing protein n=1 Tax=Butyrivibrio sp. MC2013 TaxID=1280686 RepID=UPI00040B5091|nr:helix-turn-helix domain-containing protein [Butyrivibrio sp. MC2013]
MNIEKEWNEAEYEMTENEIIHKPLTSEYNLYAAVVEGDMDYVRKDCAEGGFANPEGMGVLSNNSLRNIKYHFVTATALITRHCAENGMDKEQAFRLSDFYILKMDTLQSFDEVVALHDQMCQDFCGKMKLLKSSAALSMPVTHCLNYIYEHVNEKLELADLAMEVNVSPSYLSKLFSKELGVSVSEYIRSQKIEKARNLLKYSDYDFANIANYLAFSSQSHFIDTFKKYTGMTPKKYRDKYYSTTWK